MSTDSLCAIASDSMQHSDTRGTYVMLGRLLRYQRRHLAFSQFQVLRIQEAMKLLRSESIAAVKGEVPGSTPGMFYTPRTF
jgi:hypothetical protein